MSSDEDPVTEPRPDPVGLPQALWDQVDQIADRFERAWKFGSRPDIAHFLPIEASLLRAALPELVRVDFECRCQAGENPDPSDYRRRFPQLATDEGLMQCLLDQRERLRANAAAGGLRPSSAPVVQIDMENPQGLPRRTGSDVKREQDMSTRISPLPDTKPGIPSALELWIPPKAVPDQIGRYRVLRPLGEGAFGLVLLARDDQLQRDVAVKVPRPERVAHPDDALQYLTEARTLAQLDHPGIVRIFDVGQTPDGLCYIVSAYIEGGSLDQYAKGRKLSLSEAALLLAGVADALGHAHARGLVHRDVKPANILVDAGGKPVLADFGLALRERDFGSGSTLTGTPAYMSPEQARGEGHRVDARSDLFSLGAVLFKLLTGRLPFESSTVSGLMNKIGTSDAPSPRQFDPGLPLEAERICLKAMARRASDRYATAHDLAEDLRRLAVQPVPTAPTLSGTSSGSSAGSTPSGVRVVPKGLRAFDAHDAEFFLDLLPGPRDRHGLPDSLRFWKSRIEPSESDAPERFSVGLIYGPSGCGKSSLVKAGLLPRLGKETRAIYVEATADGTEVQLCRALTERLAPAGHRSESTPVIPPEEAGPELIRLLTELRRGTSMPTLLILDQFEQWLNSHPDLDAASLTNALRQCDGRRVQAIVMVRDDFYAPANRLFQRLEIPLVEGRNQALVDLFDASHARKVLTSFGAAYSQIDVPEASRDQQMFLDQAVAELSDEGKVIPVHLALFAEMVKAKPWTPATLRELGGVSGVGVTFLDETFGAKSAPVAYRRHQFAARAVLQALLPISGSGIKGRRESTASLQAAAGLTQRPGDFADLLRVLDTELRLITPIESEEDGEPPADERAAVSPADTGTSTPHGSSDRYYQLTHDYLVPALREWVTRKQQETPRGRAELRLAERTAAWTARQESQQLPTLTEWLSIRLWVPRPSWTDGQRRMMHLTTRRICSRLAAGATVILAALSVGLLLWIQAADRERTMKATALVERLLTAQIDQVPGIVDELDSDRAKVDPKLHALLNAGGLSQARELRVRLGVLPVDANQIEPVWESLLSAEPGEVGAIVKGLAPHADQLRNRAWELALSTESRQQHHLLPAAAFLAQTSQGDSRWTELLPLLARELALVSPFFIRDWVEVLRPVCGSLAEPLKIVCLNDQLSELERSNATELLDNLAADRPELLTEVLVAGTRSQFLTLLPKLELRRADAIPLLQRELAAKPSPDADSDKETRAIRQANAAVALFRLEDSESVWPLLVYSADPRRRTEILHRLAEYEAVPEPLIKRLRERLVRRAEQLRKELPSVPRLTVASPEASEVRTLLLSLGEFWGDGIDEHPGTLGKVVPKEFGLVEELLAVYRDDSDPGIHAAAEWLLRRWGKQAELASIDEHLASATTKAGGRSWFVNSERQTFVVIPGPVEVLAGSPVTEPEREERDEDQQLKKIRYSFAIASHEVTVAEFLRFKADFDYSKQYARFPGDSVNSMPFYHACAYCNWLSRQEKLPECYLPNDKGLYEAGMRLAPDFLKRAGYRLPTEAEWEFACRALTTTSRYYGETEPRLIRYAWYSVNSQDRGLLPPGTLKPNDLGLFDMNGNVFEWCHDDLTDETGKPADAPGSDSLDQARVLRGGSFFNLAALNRSAFRFRPTPDYRGSSFGFRLARTCSLNEE